MLLPRRLLLSLPLLLPSPPPSTPAPPACGPAPTPFCLGPVDGLLADCLGRSCASTQDDRPEYFLPPWDLDGSKDPLDRVLLACRQRKDFSAVVSYDVPAGYLRVAFVDGATLDDVEFLKTANDDTMQLRSSPRAPSLFSASQPARLEELRKALGYQPLAVIRNRRRALFFVESKLDSFGPSSNRDPDVYGMRDADPKAPRWEEGGRIKKFLEGEADDRVRSK